MKRRAFLQGAAAAALLGAVPPRAKLKAGQIGTAHSHAAGKMEAVRRLSEHFEVVGLVGDGPGRAYEGLPRLDEKALFDDPDVKVVLVETDVREATAAARRAVEAGKHVHLDKPGGLDHAEFAAMRRRAEERGRIVQMGYMLRHNPAFELLFRAVRDGWLGEVAEVTATMGKVAGPAARKELAGWPGAGMFELGCHMVDAVLTVLGPPAKVTAWGRSTGGDALPDNQLAVLEYPKALATLRCNHNDPGGFERRSFEAVGTQGSIRIAPLESGKLVLQLARAAGGFEKGAHALELKLPAGRYDGEFLHLAAAIRGEVPFGWSAAHDIAVHATALQAAGVPSK